MRGDDEVLSLRLHFLPPGSAPSSLVPASRVTRFCVEIAGNRKVESQVQLKDAISGIGRIYGLPMLIESDVRDTSASP
jgi:hypothetical protein